MGHADLQLAGCHKSGFQAQVDDQSHGFVLRSAFSDQVWFLWAVENGQSCKVCAGVLLFNSECPIPHHSTQAA